MTIKMQPDRSMQTQRTMLLLKSACASEWRCAGTSPLTFQTIGGQTRFFGSSAAEVRAHQQRRVAVALLLAENVGDARWSGSDAAGRRDEQHGQNGAVRLDEAARRNTGAARATTGTAVGPGSTERSSSPALPALSCSKEPISRNRIWKT